jgi:hypothetical protein
VAEDQLKRAVGWWSPGADGRWSLGLFRHRCRILVRTALFEYDELREVRDLMRWTGIEEAGWAIMKDETNLRVFRFHAHDLANGHSWDIRRISLGMWVDQEMVVREAPWELLDL